LRDTSLRTAELDNIVLVGGATRMPLVRSLVGKMFGRLPSCHLNPDEVVAMGAAIQAGLKSRDSALKEVVLTDVSPYTLGTEIAMVTEDDMITDGHFLPIIERNTVIPVSRVERVFPIHKKQRKVEVSVFQGESRRVENNISLGKLTVSLPKKGDARKQPIDIRFTYDINGILEIEVTIVSTGVKIHTVIEENPGVMTQEEIEKRFWELAALKIHPRDQMENKLLLTRGERLFEESLGEKRQHIAHLLGGFEAILERQDADEIRKACKELEEILNELEADICIP